jgi:hypothetical protein
MTATLTRPALRAGLLIALAAALPVLAQSPVQKVQLVAAETLASLPWQTLATEAKDDTLHPRLPDANELAYAVDAKGGLVWFRATSHRPLPERFFGINVAIDHDGDPNNGLTWWGTNKFKLDRLASAYLFRAEGYWQGVLGVADGEHAGRFVFTNLSQDAQAALDRERQAIFLGVPRAMLGDGPTVRVIATLGSMLVNNDDIPNEGALTVKLKP